MGEVNSMSELLYYSGGIVLWAINVCELWQRWHKNQNRSVRRIAKETGLTPLQVQSALDGGTAIVEQRILEMREK
jgi:hypothetical protein